MIKSILDTDLYKFTTSYAYMNKYPDAIGTFEFVDRNKTKLTYDQFQEVIREIENLKSLKLTEIEKQWCIDYIPFIPQYYWEWLSTFRFEFDKITISTDMENHLRISVTDKLYKVTLYEIAILAIVSEVLCKYTIDTPIDFTSARERLLNKISIARENKFKFSEFGTRRRYSYEVQDWVCRTLAGYGADVCVGTSNVHFAMKYSLKPMGTHPHEWFMFHGAQYGYKNANYMALEAWQDIYQGDLGIALTDTYTSDVFFRNFSKKHAKLFDGIRHDSGDWLSFTLEAMQRYMHHGIDPMTKTIIFSDGLDFEKAAEINEYCKDKIKCSFGIGTNLTNDVGAKPCNIVMKLTECRMNRNQPLYKTIKLSDVEGKHIGPEKEIEIAKYQLNIK